MINTVFLFLKGIVIGLANIIPGVSGGAMALVLGIYDRLIRAIGRIGPGSVRSLGAALRGPERGAALVRLGREHEVWFLGWILVGALAAIVATSKLMVYLLREQHDPTYGFFWGLIAASVVVPLSMVSRRTWRELACALVAVAITVGIGAGISPEERLETAKKKQEMRAAAKADDAAATEAEEPEADHSAGRLILVGIAGAVAISAMVLPGVSGSFVLLLFGMYFEILAAVNDRDFVVLAVFALGCLLGLAFFSRLLAFLLDRFRSQTMAFLVGLMVGSLWSIWPFKSFEIVGTKRIDLANAWPEALGGNEIWTVVAMIVGVGIVLPFVFYDRSKTPEAPEETT